MLLLLLLLLSKRNALSYTTRKLVPSLRSSNYLQTHEKVMGTHKMSHEMSLGTQGIIEQLFWKDVLMVCFLD